MKRHWVVEVPSHDSSGWFAIATCDDLLVAAAIVRALLSAKHVNGYTVRIVYCEELA